MPAYVYILASKKGGTLYIGCTTNIAHRLEQHASGKGSSFTSRYSVQQLVHAETFDDLTDARRREAALKKWNRAWKIRLIEDTNPDWRDLRFDLLK
jgi:putative endonuclease